MSATNRGSEREPFDDYATPDFATIGVLPELLWRLQKAQIDEIRDRWRAGKLVIKNSLSPEQLERVKEEFRTASQDPYRAPIISSSMQMMPRSFRVLEPCAGAGAIVQVLQAEWPGVEVESFDLRRDGIDFLQVPPRPEFDLIITNPPYSIAMDVVQAAMKWRRGPTSIVAMLLRLNWLGSQQRAAWLRENPPTVLVSPRRPSFVRKRTDAAEYGWIVWDGERPTVGFLHTERVVTQKRNTRTKKSAKTAASESALKQEVLDDASPSAAERG